MQALSDAVSGAAKDAVAGDDLDALRAAVRSVYSRAIVNVDERHEVNLKPILRPGLLADDNGEYPRVPLQLSGGGSEHKPVRS
jgi:hypothetical protein